MPPPSARVGIIFAFTRGARIAFRWFAIAGGRFTLSWPRHHCIDSLAGLPRSMRASFSAARAFARRPRGHVGAIFGLQRPADETGVRGVSCWLEDARRAPRRAMAAGMKAGAPLFCATMDYAAT